VNFSTHQHITPGQEYVACDRSGYRCRINHEQTDMHYVQVTDLTDGTSRKVKPENLHTDPKRRTGYLLASLVDAEWESHPATQGSLYRTQLSRIADRAAKERGRQS
jgi:hypothetical protein